MPFCTDVHGPPEDEPILTLTMLNHVVRTYAVFSQIFQQFEKMKFTTGPLGYILFQHISACCADIDSSENNRCFPGNKLLIRVFLTFIQQLQS